jgi:hypothetical protein
MCGTKTLRLAHPGSPTQKRTIPLAYKLVYHTSPNISTLFYIAKKIFYIIYIENSGNFEKSPRHGKILLDK